MDDLMTSILKKQAKPDAKIESVETAGKSPALGGDAVVEAIISKIDGKKSTKTIDDVLEDSMIKRMFI